MEDPIRHTNYKPVTYEIYAMRCILLSLEPSEVKTELLDALSAIRTAFNKLNR